MISSSKLRILVPAVVLVVSVLASTSVVWFANGIDSLKTERAETLPHQSRTFGRGKVLSKLDPPASGGAFLNKPLFLAERDALQRPAEPVLMPERKEEEAPPPQIRLPEPLDLKVVGVISDNGKFLGLFLPQSGDDLVRLSVGEQYREWTLESFETDSVIFVSGSRSETLHVAE